MNEIEKHNEINNYLKGKLEWEQLAQFEKRLESEPLFKEEVEMHQLANEAIISGAKLKLKSQLQDIHIEHEKAKKLKLIKIIAFALIGVVLMATVFILSRENAVSTNIEDEDVKKNIVENSNNQDASDQAIIKIDSTQKSIETEDYYKKIITEVLAENNILNSDSVIESIGSIEHILIDPDKHLNQIKEQRKIDSLKIPIEEQADSLAEEVVISENSCEVANELYPKYRLIQPVFGGASGNIEFDQSPNEEIIFTDFSMDNGNTFEPAYMNKTVNKGAYQLVAKDENGCLSKILTLKIEYKDANYIIQPASNKYWEIEIPEIESFPLDLEIRNARTGALVYNHQFNYSEKFIWKGLNQNNEPLSLGNYVFIFTSKQDGLIAKGQITLL